MAGYDIPYVPSSDESTATLVDLAEVRAGDKVIDLGSGEGKLVMALAAAGADATGVEIDRGRAVVSAGNIAEAGLQGKARIIHGSLWNLDLSRYDIIVLYGVPSIMGRLERKIRNEARPGVRVVSNYFEFPDWEPERIEHNILLYRPLIPSGQNQRPNSRMPAG